MPSLQREGDDIHEVATLQDCVPPKKKDAHMAASQIQLIGMKRENDNDHAHEIDLLMGPDPKRKKTE